MKNYRWFVTCQFTQFEGGHLEPASMKHAKTMGTTRTACGLSALTWTKFWNLPYTTGTSESCKKCDLILAFSEVG